ncbi:MAG TPA: hypothetical protein VHO27_13420 [Angustibacter sp.]|nr:hypothetical protein [Angustibacter sp.]
MGKVLGCGEELLAHERDHGAGADAADQDGRCDQREPLPRQEARRPGALQPLLGRDDDGGPRERERPEPQAERQSAKQRQQPQLGQHHEDAVTREQLRHEVDPAVMEAQPRRRGDGCGRHLDGERRVQCLGQWRSGDEASQDDRAEDDPAQGAIPEQREAERALPDLGGARRAEQSAGHGGQEVSRVDLVQRVVAVDELPGEPAPVQHEHHDERVDDHHAGPRRVRVQAQGGQAHRRDGRQRDERREHRVHQVGTDGVCASRLRAVRHQQQQPHHGGQQQQTGADRGRHERRGGAGQPAARQSDESETHPERVWR